MVAVISESHFMHHGHIHMFDKNKELRKKLKIAKKLML